LKPLGDGQAIRNDRTFKPIPRWLGAMRRVVRPAFGFDPRSAQKDMPVKHLIAAIVLAGGPFVVGASIVFVDGSGDPTAVKREDGRYYDKEGNPTYKVQNDGTVDWSTYSGFRRYHSDCHVCHGPDGEGSSYAPALNNSLKTMNYSDFVNVVVNGRKNVNTAQESVMPAFGTNPNVTCYLDDIFVYLRARANDAVPRGRPQKHEDKPEAVAKPENSCLGQRN
jgi:methanol metabolism-related c-type cytochrome